MSFPANGDDDPPQLLKRVQQGDPRTFEDLFALHNKPLCLWIGSREFVEKEDIHDIASETWEKVWEKRFCIGSVFNFKAWLWKIAYNTAIDHARRRKRRKENRILRYLRPRDEQHDEIEIPDPDTFEDEIEKKMLMDEALNKTFKRVTHTKKWAFIRYGIEEEPLAEVARSLNVSKDTVKVYCSIVKKIFREEYRRLLEGDGHNE
jgi:RNA polymerase sigma-70 factor, ECF subfamily